ncbi:MAG: phosphoribosylformimino-5-aminoimidazole carboxamide ribotide isomerase [Sphingomonadales bacterium]|nr:phosphoribosylformimino-5-aminoimidazole carboxamide ribotide isomerase [Sphingomonadales bacterium]
MFTPIPAIDIRGGRCVRLVEGDFARETRYADDPAAMACHWEAEGAQRLHVVDLDGARDGVRANADVIRRVLAAAQIPVQVGGGVRSSSTVQTLLGQGAARVVVGTVAAEKPDELAEWVTEFGSEAIIVAVDARGGRVATHGWMSVTDLDFLTFCQRLKDCGVDRVLYTDVARDGRLAGPDVDGTRAIAGLLKVIGSGGVSTVEHLRALAAAGAEGAIIGTALYEGRLKLSEAMATAC